MEEKKKKKRVDYEINSCVRLAVETFFFFTHTQSRGHWPSQVFPLYYFWLFFFFLTAHNYTLKAETRAKGLQA